MDKNYNKIFKNYDLCDNCLGRLLEKKKCIDYDKIGKNIRLKYDLNKTKIRDCYICEGLLSEIDFYVDLILNKLKNYEFETFLIGSKIEEDILEKEKELLKIVDNDTYYHLKNEINKKIGLILEQKLKKTVEFEKPDIMIILDTKFNNINLQIQPVYIYGRYKKFSRKLPQTKWFCRICKGIGCRACNYSGTKYKKSVEQLIAKYFLKDTKALKDSFHGAGREDIDVKMLGNGRPFILELKDPKIRNVDLDKLSRMINEENNKYIEISNLRFTNREEIKKVKNSKYKKIYEIKIKSDTLINNEKLKKVAKSLQGKTIKQKTPSRVAHRRADLVRKRKIYNFKIKHIEGAIFTLIIKSESGTYIKELITGDNGRTQPNVSDLLNTPCEVKKLDVIEIKGE